MTRPAVTYPDAERRALEDLASDLAVEIDAEVCTVGISLPTDWTTSSPARVRVALDGSPNDLHPVVHRPTIRVTVWADTPTKAKELAQLARGHLLTRTSYKPLIGVFVAYDDDHRADLASFTVRATVRSEPIT